MTAARAACSSHPARTAVAAPALALALALVSAACAKPPPACADAELVAATHAEEAGERTYAPATIAAAVDATERARQELAAQKRRMFSSYDKAAALCAQAHALGLAAVAAVERAKQRRAESEAVVAATKSALGEADRQLTAGRALLDAVPQPDLDERMRKVVAARASAQQQAGTVAALVQGSGWADADGLTALTNARAQASGVRTDADAVVRDIRRAATARCKPRGLVLGIRARSHDEFAIVEAGPSEEDAHGHVVVVERDERRCRTLHAWKPGDPQALPLEADLSTWHMGGMMPMRLLFAWSGSRAWFVGDLGAWAFDAAKVSGFTRVCESLTCATPTISGDHIDATCTCAKLKPGVDDLELSRTVRFSWHGNGVLAER